MKKQTEPKEQNYTLGWNVPLQLHGYGGYMSYSDHTGDYLATAKELQPFRVMESRNVQVGTKQEIMKQKGHKKEYNPAIGRETMVLTGDDTTVVVDVPVYDVVWEDVTPAFKAFGKPIQVGDTVDVLDTTGGVRFTGALLVLTNTHVAVRSTEGMWYLPWSEGLTVKRHK